MKTFTPLKRLGRWALAASLCMGFALPTSSARAGGSITKLDFTKRGEQISCELVEFHFEAAIPFDPDQADNAFYINHLTGMELSFRDKLPDGLSWTDVGLQITGDVTGPGGGAVPPFKISTFAHPDDVLELNDFRWSANDLDGSGKFERNFEIVAYARIDKSKFPAPAVVLNHAELSDGINVFMSNDPSLPAPADPKNGKATAVQIDLTDCDKTPPGGGDGSEANCFETDDIKVVCDEKLGEIIYKMVVGPEQAGQTIELVSTTPGVSVEPPSQVVPAGGGVLEWKLVGAGPGMDVHLQATGVDYAKGPKDGLGLCCSQEIVVHIPEEIDCPDVPDPNIRVDKEALDDLCDPLVGGCKFKITVTWDGPGTYDGDIYLWDDILPKDADLDAPIPAPWQCGDLPAMGANAHYCKYPNAHLNPGESVSIVLSFKPGPAWVGEDAIENCAEYSYADSGKDPFGNPDDDWACAQIPICVPGTGDPRCPRGGDNPNLEILKTGKYCYSDTVTGGVAGKTTCAFDILVNNISAVDYDGALTVIDEFDAPAPDSVTFSPNPPWSCVMQSPTKFRCDYLGGAHIPAGAQAVPLHVEAVVNNPANYPSEKIRNCASLKELKDGEDPASNGPACAELAMPQPPVTEPPGRADIEIDKQCEAGIAGRDIPCRITVTNKGTAAPEGAVRVDDQSWATNDDAPVAMQTVLPDGPEWSCGVVPSSTLKCKLPGSALPPGASRHFDVTLSVSGKLRFRNCAKATYHPVARDDTRKTTPEACAESGIDIVVEKTGDTECEGDSDCHFQVIYKNKGKMNFSGPVLVTDGIIAGPAMRIVSINPPLGCASEPTQLPFSCSANVNIAAGTSQVHEITVRVPDDPKLEGRSLTNCVTVADKGAKPEVDPNSVPQTGQPAGEPSYMACHTFRIAPDEPVCFGGMVLNQKGLCECPQGTEWNGRRCADSTHLPPPPLTAIPKPGPTCPSDRTLFDKQSDVPQGWLRYRRTRNGMTVWCAKPRDEGPGPGCRRGWKSYASRSAIPQGWRKYSVTRNGQTVWCGKPKPFVPQCPKGWDKVDNVNSVPSGWQIIVVDGIAPDGTKYGIYCAKPKPVIEGPKCRKGWDRFEKRSDIPHGWRRYRTSRNGIRVWCAKPPVTLPGPQCRRGWKPFDSNNDVPKGWQSYRATKNGQTIWCAKPRDVVVGPTCRSGWTRFNRRSDIPQGWKRYRRTRNGISIWCAKPRDYITCPKSRQKPNGGCCPSGQVWGIPQSTTLSSVPTARCYTPGGGHVSCPKIRRKSNGGCCPAGTRASGNRCRTVEIDPGYNICPKARRKKNGGCCPAGTRASGNRCRTVEIDPGYNVCPKARRKKNGGCCPRNRIALGNACIKLNLGVPTPGPSCPRSRRKRNGGCCPVGTHSKRNRCISNNSNGGDIQVSCPRSRRKRNGGCCPVGTHSKRNRCISNNSSGGNIQVSCPRSRRKRNGGCCPAGTYSKRNRCVSSGSNNSNANTNNGNNSRSSCPRSRRKRNGGCCSPGRIALGNRCVRLKLNNRSNNSNSGNRTNRRNTIRLPNGVRIQLKKRN